MVEPTIFAILQAIFLLTFPWGLHLFLSWMVLFSQWLDLQAPSHGWIHCKHYHQCHLPRKAWTRHKRRRGWETSFHLEKGSCPSRLTYFCGPPSGLVARSEVFSAKLTWKPNKPFSAASLWLRMWGRKQQKFLEPREERSFDCGQALTYLPGLLWFWLLLHLPSHPLHSNPFWQQESFPRPATLQWKKCNWHLRRFRDCRWRHICLPN